MVEEERLKELIEILPKYGTYMGSAASVKEDYMLSYLSIKDEIITIIGKHDDPLTGTRREQGRRLETIRKKLEDIYHGKR